MIDTKNFTLTNITSEYIDEIKEQRKFESKTILLKIQRDLLAISNTIICDKNFENNKNHQKIKEQIQILLKYMYSQIEYIKLACEYENTTQADNVRDRLLSCEYSKTKYNITYDYEFWKNHDIYKDKGAYKQLERLNIIHDSDLSKKNAILFVDSLEYETIRNNNWGRNNWKRYCGEYIPTDLYSNKDLGLAREKFRKDRNSSLKELYNIFDFINFLTNILTSDYNPQIYDYTSSISYKVKRVSQININNESNNFQKKLKHSSNASCWL